MPFLEHLEELRWRLIWAVGALMIGVAVGMVVCTRIDVLAYLAAPGLKAMHGQQLIVTHPADTFTLYLQVSAIFGLVLASPVVVYQAWAFLSPALHAHERRVAVSVVLGSVFLFVSGVVLAYTMVLPVTLELLVGMSSTALRPMFTAADYFSFTIMLCLAFGAAFELPILVLALTAIGLVTPALLAKYRRHAFVVCLLASAMLIPGDLIITTLMMLVPLYGLYELSIILSWIVFRKRDRAAADAPGSAVA